MQLIFEQIRTGGDRNFAYLLGDRDAGRGVVIDPSYAPDVVCQRATDQGLTVPHVVNTHGHPDHTEGNETAVAITGAPVAAHPDLLGGAGHPLADGDTLAVGAFGLRCFYTPGHCPDHLVLYEPFCGHHRLRCSTVDDQWLWWRFALPRWSLARVLRARSP